MMPDHTTSKTLYEPCLVYQAGSADNRDPPLRSRWGPVRAHRHAGLALLASSTFCLWLLVGHSAGNVAFHVPGLAAVGETVSAASEQTAITSLSDEHVTSAVNKFGLTLLSEVHRFTDMGNVFISPASVVSTLGMVALGATPGSKAQEEILAAWGVDAKQAPAFFSIFHDHISQAMTGHSGVQFLSANSVWCKGVVKQAFVAAAQKTFEAEAMSLPTAPEPINAWVSEKTTGMIPSIIDSIDSRTIALLVNAVYFKGQWTTQFQKGHSQKGVFRSATRGALPCVMMRRVDHKMRFAEDGRVQLVELPYGDDGRLAAIVLLPLVHSPTVSDLALQLGSSGHANGSLAQLLAGLAPTHIELQLPRFRLEFGVHDLKPQLQSAFGISEAFVGENGFRAMSDDPEVHLSQVLHKAVVEVNEEGTTAAAATAGVMMTRAIMIEPPPKLFTVDRPFLFLIRDVRTGTLMFTGIVQDPEFPSSSSED